MDLDAMKALLAAVERETLQRVDWSFGKWPDGLSWDTVYAAYNGSMDYALALHGALLPDTLWELYFNGVEYGANLWLTDTAYAPTPARALLIATLRGVIAKMGAEHVAAD